MVRRPHLGNVNEFIIVHKFLYSSDPNPKEHYWDEMER